MEETALELAATKFLNTGIAEGIKEAELATGCERLVQNAAHQSLKSALVLAKRFVSRSANSGGLLELTACRSLARITHMSGAHQEALGFYIRARELARSNPLIRARIDRALIDLYMYLGDFTKARIAARSALATFRAIKSEVDEVQTMVNYANLLHRQDRHRDAEQLYHRAAEFFEKNGDELAVARCYYNRANTLVQLFDMRKAETLYQQAEQIYGKAGYTLEACDARYGLAWLRMLTGKYHQALHELMTCEETYREGGDPRGEALCTLDRAEVYLGLGLYHDALASAQRAEKLFSKLDIRYEEAKAALFRGQAAQALHKNREASSSLARALKGFAEERNNGFLGVSHLLAADLAENDEKKKYQELRLARSRFATAQLPFWEAICDLREARDSKYSDRALANLSRSRAASEVPYLYILWQTISGDREFDRGRIGVARRHWRKAADRLDSILAQLPPLELRLAYGRRHDSPHLKLIASELDHDLRQAAVWSERFKTAGVWAPLSTDVFSEKTRREIGESLDILARQVGVLAQRIEGHGGERSLNAPMAGRQLSRLKKQVREKLMAIDNESSGSEISTSALIADFKALSNRLPIIQFHCRNEEIVAFIHNRGETSLRRFHDGRRRLSNAMRQWRFILEGELLSGYLGQVTKADSERLLWEQLGEWLWAPLEIDGDSSQILILPEGELANLPWQALICDGRPLMEDHQFLLAPSLRHFLTANRTVSRSDNIEIFRGLAGGLPGAERELTVILENSDGKATFHNPCLRKDWPSSGNARLWHFTGHAELCTENPFYSYLVMEDGPLFAADFRLKQCRVSLVTLAACRSGEQVALPGEEATGLVRSLLEMGARNVIASHWPVSDKTTALWMEAFYNKFFAGDNILDAARCASGVVREKFPSAYYWAAFSISGAGDMGDKYEK